MAKIGGKKAMNMDSNLAKVSEKREKWVFTKVCKTDEQWQIKVAKMDKKSG